jgi:hypothetical protein
VVVGRQLVLLHGHAPPGVWLGGAAGRLVAVDARPFFGDDGLPSKALPRGRQLATAHDGSSGNVITALMHAPPARAAS